MGKCCVSGVGALNVSYKDKTVEIDGIVYKEGDFISLNGTTGQVYAGEVPTKAAELSGDFKELMDLCDKYTKLQVRTNADTPRDAQLACEFGAKGIGLTRTEHMFFEDKKIIAMREMILASDAAKEVFQEYGMEVEFEIGTMIEIPRAALTADRIATEAQYFSFGTNDLTQMTFGYSRDDIASFLPVYLDKKILKVDPFQVLDQKGVGKLIKYAVKSGREVRPAHRTSGRRAGSS